MNRRRLVILVIIVIALLVWFVQSKTKIFNNTSPDKGTTAASDEVSDDKTAQELYEQAKVLLEDRELLKSKEIYQKILSDYPDYEYIADVQKDLENLNMQIILSNAQAPGVVVHEVVSGDTLGELAKKYGTTIDLIKIRNNLKNSIIRVGQRLSIWTNPFNILVDKSQNILMLKSNGELIKVYKVSTGKNNSTPIGECKVNSKLIDPVWFNKGVVVPPESPANVLGSRWLGFDNFPGYGIHGTIEPGTIGSQSTAGCVRMLNSDVEELYSIIPYNTEVKIVD